MAERDRGINRMENVHDTRCLRILALYQPEADDLRTVFMAEGAIVKHRGEM